MGRKGGRRGGGGRGWEGGEAVEGCVAVFDLYVRSCGAIIEFPAPGTRGSYSALLWATHDLGFSTSAPHPDSCLLG
jgi:hypothetical protein